MMKLFFLLCLLSFSSLSVAQDSDDFDFNFDETELEESLENSTDDLDFSENELKPVNSEETQEEKITPSKKGIQTSRKRKGRYIYHPNQKKGLYKINRENEYFYRYKKSPSKRFINIKGGAFSFENLGDGSGLKFEDYYDKETATALLLEYEWEPFKKHRSLSLKGGFGAAFAKGTGQFITPQPSGQDAQEKYTFVMLPLSFGVTYKFKFINDQLFLPFVTGGLDYNFGMEFRKSFKAFKYNGIFGAHFGGGVGINLGWLERSAALNLDQEFGINNTYLVLEARTIVSFEKENDLNGLMFVAGLSFEY